MAFCFKPLNCKSVNRNLANYFKAKKHFIKYFIMNHSENDRCPFLLQWDTNHMSQDLLMLMSLLISTLSCSFPVIVERERERDWGRDTEKKSFRLWIDSLRSIRNYQPLQLRFLLHLNKLSDKCRAKISTVEIVICIIAPIVNALKLKNPCMCTILNANFSKLSLINSLGGKSNFDKLYWKKSLF